MKVMTIVMTKTYGTSICSFHVHSTRLSSRLRRVS